MASYALNKLAFPLPGALPRRRTGEKKLLVDAAHVVCPYSNATRGNIDVELVIA